MDLQTNKEAIKRRFLKFFVCSASFLLMFTLGAWLSNAHVLEIFWRDLSNMISHSLGEANKRSTVLKENHRYKNTDPKSARPKHNETDQTEDETHTYTYNYNINFDETSYCSLCNRSDEKPSKMIFQVGFHKTATRTIQHLVRDSGYDALHWLTTIPLPPNTTNAFEKWQGLKIISHVLHENYFDTKPLLDGLCHENDYFGDFGVAVIQADPHHDMSTTDNLNPQLLVDQSEFFLHQYRLIHKDLTKWYTLIDQYYPDCSVFILNVRDLENWLLSRVDHDDGEWVKFFMNPQLRPLADRNTSNLNTPLTLHEVKHYWTIDFYDHICHMLRYFHQHPNPQRKNDLLIFDVENEDPKKLFEFVEKYGYNVSEDYWINRNNAHHHTKEEFLIAGRPWPIDDIKSKCALQNAIWIH